MATDRFQPDSRLKKTDSGNSRADRASSDVQRTQHDGGSLTPQERRRLLRQEWVQEVLPTPNDVPGFHFSWLSTTNSTDPIYKRIQRGYIPVKKDEVQMLGSQYVVQGGEFDGCIQCNEMLLFKIPSELFEDIMIVNHHDMPAEQEEAIYERAALGQQHRDSAGRDILSVDGDFERFRRSRNTPPSFK